MKRQTEATGYIEKPIIFSEPMVRAILEGRKTQTRRVMKPQPPSWLSDGQEPWNIDGDIWGFASKGLPRVCRSENTICCPHPVGSRIWVRETWRPWNDEAALWSCVQYRADMAMIKPKGLSESDGWKFEQECEATITDQIDGNGSPWKPSIFMPRWASRIMLEVTAVKVERVASISEQDALAEGVQPGFYDGAHWEESDDPNCPAAPAFERLWDSLYATRPGCSFEANPYVWAYTFRRIK